MTHKHTAPRLRLVVAGLALVLTVTAYATQSVPTPGAAPGLVTSIDKVLADAVTRWDIPGVVAVATDRRGILYQGAFGAADVATSRPLTVDAIFRIASMTKPVTSVAAMQLVEQGRLRLDDPAEKYLPDLANLKVFATFDSQTGAYAVRPATKTMTVRHLLTHTSGLGMVATSPILRDFKPRNGEQYPAGPLLFEPGEQWLYGASTDWLGRVVESVSGQNLDMYFRDHIFGPLRMMDTFYNIPEDRRHRLVAGHRRRSDSAFVVTQSPSEPASLRSSFGGGNGLASTAMDYARFLQMFLNNGTLNGVRILSADTIKLMSQNQIGKIGVPALKIAVPETSNDFTFIADGRDKFGLGFLITADQQLGKRSAGSLSWVGVQNTYFWVDPTRGIAGIVLMQFTPAADSKALAVLDAFERAIYQLPTVSRP